MHSQKSKIYYLKNIIIKCTEYQHTKLFMQHNFHSSSKLSFIRSVTVLQLLSTCIVVIELNWWFVKTELLSSILYTLKQNTHNIESSRVVSRVISESGFNKDYCHLRCDAMQNGRQVATFQRMLELLVDEVSKDIIVPDNFLKLL